ncbi:MAG: hypothetical protein JXB05_36325 [Myxococcaceae bacterium]|nr:hypothetical protein [Myxococcaceae bacterium]
MSRGAVNPKRSLVGADGTLWQWFGYGPGSAPPTPVEGMTNVVAVAHTEGGTLHVVRADGTVWSKGFNSFGVLGVPDVTRAEDWTQVPGLTDAVSLARASMESRALALRANGTAVSWGNNFNGSIGDGISSVHLTPTRVLLPCRLLAAPSWEEAHEGDEGPVEEARRCRAAQEGH